MKPGGSAAERTAIGNGPPAGNCGAWILMSLPDPASLSFVVGRGTACLGQLRSRVGYRWSEGRRKVRGKQCIVEARPLRRPLRCKCFLSHMGRGSLLDYWRLGLESFHFLRFRFASMGVGLGMDSKAARLGCLGLRPQELALYILASLPLR